MIESHIGLILPTSCNLAQKLSWMIRLTFTSVLWARRTTPSVSSQGFPLRLENLKKKWEGIFHSGNFEQTRKVREFQTCYLVFLVICVLFAKMFSIKINKTFSKWGVGAGKVGEFSQSGKVGTMSRSYIITASHPYKKRHNIWCLRNPIVWPFRIFFLFS